MTLKRYFCFCFFLMCHFLCAQNDSINVLEEVLVSDNQLRNYSNAQSVIQLRDSAIAAFQPSLTGLLRHNSTMHFRENGFGMVSSPAFRGTSAQHTAVIWNGININSQLNGQTDFNTISAGDFSSIEIRPGGGSIIYGSSAIGGSVHLNSDLTHSGGSSHNLQVGYGSFNTANIIHRSVISSDDVDTEISFSRNSSDNDFEIPQQNRRNVNGQFAVSGLNAAASFRIGRNAINLYSRASLSDRNFSLVQPTDTKTWYSSVNTANMLEFVHKSQFGYRIKLAHIGEQYQYYPDIDQQQALFGEASTWLLRPEFSIVPIQNSLLTAVAEYNHTKGNGSDINENSRENINAAILYKHQLFRSFLYELGLRKEFSDSFESPMLFSIGLKQNVTKFLEMRINASRNFRTPTLNDQFWIDGGNPDLKAEVSTQAEAGATIRKESFSLNITGFYIAIEDMIQWLPGTGVNWNPQNVAEVKTKGIEAFLNFRKRIQKLNLAAAATYAYTDSKNAATGKHLIYVPQHKATVALVLERSRVSLNMQTLFSGESFIRSDNNPRYVIEAYSVTNFSLGYAFDGKANYKLAVQVMNAFDQQYQVVDRRPFPGRHYNLNLTITL